MAIADAVGHNKRGKTIYKRNPDGTVILREVDTIKTRTGKDGDEERVIVRSRQPIVNDELEGVAAEYLEWLEAMAAMRRGKRRSS